MKLELTQLGGIVLPNSLAGGGLDSIMSVPGCSDALCALGCLKAGGGGLAGRKRVHLASAARPRPKRLKMIGAM